MFSELIHFYDDQIKAVFPSSLKFAVEIRCADDSSYSEASLDTISSLINSKDFPFIGA